MERREIEVVSDKSLEETNSLEIEKTGVKDPSCQKDGEPIRLEENNQSQEMEIRESSATNQDVSDRGMEELSDLELEKTGAKDQHCQQDVEFSRLKENSQSLEVYSQRGFKDWKDGEFNRLAVESQTRGTKRKSFI